MMVAFDKENLDVLSQQNNVLFHRYDSTLERQSLVSSSSSSSLSRDVIVYLSQGPASSYEKLKHRFENLTNAIFFYHSYDQNCNGCIFQPNTTLPQGRNLVLKSAYNTLSSQSQQRPQQSSVNNQIIIKTESSTTSYYHQTQTTLLERVKYFVMMDDDVEIQCIPTRRDCWNEYHTLILDDRTTWPLLAPKFYVDGDNEPTLYHTCRDDSLWIMRYDYISLLYPFPTKYDTKTWNIYVQAVWERMKLCFPNGFVSHQGFRNVNPRHGDYPKGLRKKLVVDILNEEYPTLGPWSIRKSPMERPFRCTPALKEPPVQQQANPECMTLAQNRFEKWLVDKEKIIVMSV